MVLKSQKKFIYKANHVNSSNECHTFTGEEVLKFLPEAAIT